MHELKSAINRLYPKIEVSTGCLFATPQFLPWINYYYSLLKNEMRLSEWGLLSTGFVAGPLMFDLDGIICLDPKPGANEKDHASMAEPKMIPSFEVACIATARYESLRIETERWLIANKVKFQTLEMLPDNIPKTFDNICRFKADCAKKVGVYWIWESDAYQAAKLHKITKLPVLCTSRMQLMSENPNIHSKRSKIRRRM